MPSDCIKQNNSPFWLEFNLLLENISLDDSIGHLFIVDIEFDEQNTTKKQYMYNEIFQPIIEKQDFKGKQTIFISTFRAF